MKTLFKNIKIPATNGKQTIADNAMFAYIDKNFKNWGLDKKEESRHATNFEVLELDECMTFKEMFLQPEKQWITQEQMLAFIKKNKDKLRQDGFATFFLLKKDDEFFVARVRVDSDGLDVSVSRFGYDYGWDADGRRRVVVPQLDSESLSPSPSDTQSLCSLDEAIKICKANGLKIIRTKVIEEEL